MAYPASSASSGQAQESQKKLTYETVTKQVSSLLEVSTMLGGGEGGEQKVNRQPKSFLFVIAENLQLSKKDLSVWV